MSGPIGSIVLLALLSASNGCYAQALGVEKNWAADQCSNEVLTLSLQPVRTPGPPRPRWEREPVPFWSGLIEVTIKNTSNLFAHLEEVSPDWEYDITVLDSSGKPLPLTDYGRKLAAQRATPSIGYLGHISVIDLQPTEELTYKVTVSGIYKIEPGQGYTVRFRRERGLPKTDQIGRPVQHPGLSCSVTIPAGPLAETR